LCEYCGCQALEAIALLTAEHDAIVNLIGEVRTALAQGRVDDAAAGCREMLVALRPHVRVEEQALFPPMRAEFPDQIDALLGEHRLIESVLAEATSGTPAGPDWPARLLAVLHDLREHILKEQDGVFPAALATLRPTDWDRLDQLRAAT
jgi:hemerythrin-like domain-containing protein